MFASWAPVTNPTDALAGMPSSSFAHPPATCSTAIEAGDSVALNAGWSQAIASMSAAVADSSAPPITKPK